NLAGPRRVDRQHALRGGERREACRISAKFGFVWVTPRGINDDNFYLCAAAMHLGDSRVDADAVHACGFFRRNLRVHRNEIVLAADLNTVAAEIENRGRALADLADEGIDRAAHFTEVQIFL